MTIAAINGEGFVLRAPAGPILVVHQQSGAVRGLARRYPLLPPAVLLRRQMGDVHVDRLHLLELGRDGAQPVANFVARQWHVLALDV